MRKTEKQLRVLIDGSSCLSADTIEPCGQNCSGGAARSFCAAKKLCYYGFNGHLMVSSEGMPLAFDIAAANADEREMIFELAGRNGMCLIGGKGHICKETVSEELRAAGIDLRTPLRGNMKDERSKWFVKALNKTGLTPLLFEEWPTCPPLDHGHPVAG